MHLLISIGFFIFQNYNSVDNNLCDNDEKVVCRNVGRADLRH